MTDELPSGVEEQQAAGTAGANGNGATGMMETATATAAATTTNAANAAAPPPPPSSAANTRTAQASKLAAALACNFCAGVLLDAVVAPNCMHAFCAPCIDAWVEARAAACPCCVASGARQPTPLGDGAYAAGRLQPDLTLRALVSKVMPFAKGGEAGRSQSTTIEEEWNLRFARALEPARRGAVAARGFLAGGAPCVGGVSAAGAAGAAASMAAAAAAMASAAAAAGNATGAATTAIGAPRFNRSAPPPRGAAVLLLLTPDPTAPRRRNPGYLQRPYVRAPRNLTLGLLGRYLSDRLRVSAGQVKWRFEARGVVEGGGGGGGGEGTTPATTATTTHDGTEAVAAAVAARGNAVTMAELAGAAWAGSEAEDDFERLDRPLVAFYRT